MATDLVTITDGSTDLVALFRGASDQIDPIIARIEAEVRAQAPDLTSKKGRDAIASLAYKVSKSKTALDEAGKALTDAQRKEIATVDAARKKIRDRLDALRDEVRQPLTDWETAEAARDARIKDTMAAIRNHGIFGHETLAEIKEAADRISAIEIGPDFADRAEIATDAKAATLDVLRGLYAAAQQRERDAAELAQLRAEADARRAADELRAAQEAEAQRVKDEAARIEAQRIADEAAAKERAARIEADKAAAAERARVDAERAAEERRKEDEHRHAQELAEAKRREERAAQAERDHIAAQAKAADDARRKREADQEYRDRIKSDIVIALQSMAGHATPDAIADALMSGKIPHCKVSM